MTTRLDWPTWSEPTDHEPVEVIYFSRFDDVVPLMSCDHAPARASILVFRESTLFVGFQEDGDGGTLMLGNCRRCKSTIAIEIDVARGHVAHGEIETPNWNDDRICGPSYDEPPPRRG